MNAFNASDQDSGSEQSIKCGAGVCSVGFAEVQRQAGKHNDCDVRVYEVNSTGAKAICK